MEEPVPALKRSDWCKIYLICLLIAAAVMGDSLVWYTRMPTAKALFDNTTHAAIGGISWLIVRMNHKTRQTYDTLLEVFVCTAISSLIDLDHFIAAKSVHLKDATNLQRRPFLHCSTLPLIVTTVALLVAYHLQYEQIRKLSLIVFTAFASHHTRDATRRGYWLRPFGSTPPVLYILYVLVTVAIPYLVCFVFGITKTKKTYHVFGFDI